MAQLGVSCRVLYSSKDFKTGLTNISAKIKKPDGNLVGPFPLSEFPDTGFEGLYYFDFVTALSDPEGDYIGVIDSPNEGNFKAPFKLSLTLGGSGSGETVIPTSESIFVTIDEPESIDVILSDDPAFDIIIHDSDEMLVMIEEAEPDFYVDIFDQDRIDVLIDC